MRCTLCENIVLYTEHDPFVVSTLSLFRLIFFLLSLLLCIASITAFYYFTHGSLLMFNWIVVSVRLCSYSQCSPSHSKTFIIIIIIFHILSTWLSVTELAIAYLSSLYWIKFLFGFRYECSQSLSLFFSFSIRSTTRENPILLSRDRLAISLFRCLSVCMFVLFTVQKRWWIWLLLDCQRERE